MKNETLLEDFREHLKAKGRTAGTISQRIGLVRRFLKHCGDTRIDRLTEHDTRSFFDKFKGQSRQQYAAVISQFVIFSQSRLPVVVNARGIQSPAAPTTKTDLALRQQWNLEALIDQKSNDDDLIAKFARKMIDHYLYFQRRVKGAPEDLDDLVRFTDECRELIETNLPLFMSLSAGGRNIHAVIDERVH